MAFALLTCFAHQVSLKPLNAGRVRIRMTEPSASVKLF
jgi:hypothetical protein